MQLYNLKNPQERVSFSEAVQKGLGSGQGLFFPESFPKFDDMDALLAMPFVERSTEILHALIGDEIPKDTLHEMVSEAFQFPAPVAHVFDNFYSLELFHGPTLAFKDFGARFLAQCLKQFAGNKKLTILTATSGDTGAAVAHAFHGIENIRVVVMYPKGKISLLQEKMFCTLGGNIDTIAIDGTFDDCQQLVKDCFDDNELRQTIGLNSANSINMSRLLAQVCYYFEAFVQLPAEAKNNLVVSVPSGNFGNLTAAMIAKIIGLPIKRFIAATNVNDTVPRYLHHKTWHPNKTVATLSNAMDVSNPNNWPRVQAMLDKRLVDADDLVAQAIDEETTQLGVLQLYKQDYVSEPHAAVAYKALKHRIHESEIGLFLGTAHPAKFRDSVENILGEMVPLPDELAEVAGKDILSINMPAEYAELRKYLMP